MTVFWVIAAVVAIVVLRSGLRPDGSWKFAPLRAVGMLAGGVFRVTAFVAVLVFALVIGVLSGTVRSTF